MQEKMNLLKELQELDQEISSIEAAQQRYRDELETFKTEAARVQEMLDELNGELVFLQQDEAQLQQNLLKERDNIVRVEGRLPEIQTQKEYVAVLKEIDMAKKANKELEEQLQAKQQEISVLEQDQLEKEEELENIGGKADERSAELSKLMGETDNALQKRRAARDSVAAELPSALLDALQTARWFGSGPGSQRYLPRL